MPHVHPEAASHIGPKAILMLAFACGVGVANVYFPQAISPLVAAGLDVAPDAAAAVVTAAQVGYAAGIFLLVPLGDRLPHRPLIVTLIVLTALGLIGAGCAPALPVLVAASAVIGLTTVVPQIIIPMAAGLVAEERRGAVLGTLLSGLIGGILLARTFSGTLGAWLGWRAPYLAAAVLMLLLAAILAFAIPATVPRSRQRYPALLAASLQLLRSQADLRRSCFYQAMLFAGFSAAWTTLALFVSGSHYGLGAQTLGVIALVGAGSMFATPIAGRLIDRNGPDRVNFVCFLGTLAAVAVLAAGARGGVVGLAALSMGMLFLDVAMQCGQVANQARIFALGAQVRSRLNTAYMTCAFLGGSAGSWLGVRAYTSLGWEGVCALVAILAASALAWHLLRPASADPDGVTVGPTAYRPIGGTKSDLVP